MITDFRPFMLFILAVLAACAPSTPPGLRPSNPVPAQTTDSVRSGRGTLHQDQFTIQLRSGALLVKVTPLADEVIRLAAPDTYERLRALAGSQAGPTATTMDDAQPRLFLVSFFSREPDTPFDPESLQLMQQGRVHSSLTIRPLSPGWGVERLPRQEVRNAIYAFDAALDLNLPFTVTYGLSTSEEWSRILLRLQIERGRVRGISGSAP